MEIRPVGSSPMHATGRMDMTQAIGDFRDYAKAPENIKLFIKYDINCLWAYS
jgi:hypothetical protein